MAIMHPADISCYKATRSEKEMYYALKKQLNDKYHVFYSVKWYDKDKNNNRINSECDFLIFDPHFGFITLEIKGGIGIKIENNTWHLLLNPYEEENDASERKLPISPYDQSENSMRYFKKYYENEYNHDYKGVYGFAVGFPLYAIDESIAHNAPSEVTIDINDMHNLGQKVNEVFHYWKGKRNIGIPFSAEQRDRFITCINKEIALAAAAGALIPIKEKEFGQINYMQESVLDILYNYRQARIIGGAGTGKTNIAIKKANRDAKANKKVLMLCCNKELSNSIKQNFEYPERIECETFDSLMYRLLGEKYNAVALNSNGSKCCFDVLSSLEQVEKYDSIIVDEAQDFDCDMGLSVRFLLKDENESNLYVFLDENQNVFSQHFENAFDIKNPPFILRYNIRNTGNIYKCAIERTKLGQDTLANTLLGVEPEIRINKNISQTLKTLTNVVNRLIQKEYVKNKSIVILSDGPIEKSVLKDQTRIGAYDISYKNLCDITDTEICFKTVEQFKGLEADIVIYLKNSSKEQPSDVLEKSKEYVALTRARYYLYIIYTQNINY